MNTLRILAAVLGIMVFALGFLMAQPDQRGTGQALIVGGAIIIAGSLVASAIAGARK